MQHLAYVGPEGVRFMFFKDYRLPVITAQCLLQRANSRPAYKTSLCNTEHTDL